MSNMNRLDTARRVQVVKCLVEGIGLRATARVTGVARMTVEKLLRDLGAACAAYQDTVLRNLTCRRLQCDEIWSFSARRTKNVTPEMREKTRPLATSGPGRRLTPTRSYRLVPRRRRASGLGVGRSCRTWRRRLTIPRAADDGRPQPYLSAVEDAFGADSRLRAAGEDLRRGPDAEKRYSPASCIGACRRDDHRQPEPEAHHDVLRGAPEPHDADAMRRFTRLTNAFSKKIENARRAVGALLHALQLRQIHGSLRVTPAMAAGVTDMAGQSRTSSASSDAIFDAGSIRTVGAFPETSTRPGSAIR